MRVARRQGRRVGRIAPRERGALIQGCVGRAPSGAARGGPARCSRPYSPRVPPACAVGARPPPRCPACRPTALAADAAGAARNLGVFLYAVVCRHAPRSIEAASGAAEASRWAVPQPQRGPAMRVPCRQGCGVGAGSRRRNVGRVSTAALGGRHRLRGARRAGLGTPAGIAAPTRANCGGRPPAAPRPNQPPNHARSRRRWRGPEAGGFLRRRLVPPLASVSNVASGAAEAGVGRSLNPYAPGHARAVPPAPRRGCRIAPRERGALMQGCGGRAPSGAARGGQDSVRLPYSPRVPPACAVGARPPPRCPACRPTALAADTAGAADNLGVFFIVVACRRAPRSIESCQRRC